MNAPKKPKNTRVVFGTFKETFELLPNGLTKKVREEKTVTLRRDAQEAEPSERS